MKKTADFAILPYNMTRIKDKFLVSNMLGGWDFLDAEEWRALTSFGIQKDTSLYNRLQERGLIADQKNVPSLLEGYRILNANLFNDTALHIVVATTRCNLTCAYCQTRSDTPQDMSVEVAVRILKYLFEVKNANVSLEFQGGEALLNWPVVRVLIEGARTFNVIGKDRSVEFIRDGKSRKKKTRPAPVAAPETLYKTLNISLVSNLLLLDDDKMQVLADNDVQVCTSFDGPEAIHDANRKYANGSGTYRQVTAKVRAFQEKYGRKVLFLPTITKHSLKHSREIIDEYVRWQQPEICLRPVNNMGSACASWGRLGYEPEEFCDFYARSMDYILELNRQGVAMTERTARIILTKILARKDPGFVDLMNPCGAGRAMMTYMPDGSCYPCDEARMVGQDLFKLGSIMEENYQDMIKKEGLLNLLHSSCASLWNYSSAFSPWTGYCPVVNYALQGNVIPKTACSPVQKILDFQFRYLFEKILEGGETLDILKGWLRGRPHGQKA